MHHKTGTSAAFLFKIKHAVICIQQYAVKQPCQALLLRLGISHCCKLSTLCLHVHKSVSTDEVQTFCALNDCRFWSRLQTTWKVHYWLAFCLSSIRDLFCIFICNQCICKYNNNPNGTDLIYPARHLTQMLTFAISIKTACNSCLLTLNFKAT